MLKFVPGSDDYSVPSSTDVEPIAKKRKIKVKMYLRKSGNFQEC